MMQPINDLEYKDSLCFSFTGVLAILFDYFMSPLIIQSTWNQVIPEVFLHRISHISYYHAFLMRILVSFWVSGISYAWINKRDEMIVHHYGKTFVQSFKQLLNTQNESIETLKPDIV